jgi:hypothetical protein
MVRRAVTPARALLVSAIPFATTLLLAAVVLAEVAGAHPFTPGPPRNAAEAAAMRDDASLLRLLIGSGGADQVAFVRPGILGEQGVLATPAEAAVLSHDRGALDLIAPRAVWTGVERAHLACLARDVQDRDLATFFDPSSQAVCGPADGLQRVQQRR